MELTEQQIQEKVNKVIEDAMEKKRIKKQINEVNKELSNIFLFRDILGIRYIPANIIINESPKLKKGFGRSYGYDNIEKEVQ